MATTHLIEDVIEALQALATAFPRLAVETSFDSEVALIIRVTATSEQVIEALETQKDRHYDTSTALLNG